MNRILLLTTIITVVYSWEEFKAVLFYALTGGRKRGSVNIDRAVGNALVLATTPAAIVWLLNGSGHLLVRLGFVLLQFIIITALMELIHIVRVRFFSGSGQLLATGLQMSNRTEFASQFITGSRMITLYIRALIWPVLIGILLKRGSDSFGNTTIDTNIDNLILVAVAGLVMNITATFLTRHLRLARFGLFEYFRIVLGLGLFILLI